MGGQGSAAAGGAQKGAALHEFFKQSVGRAKVAARGGRPITVRAKRAENVGGKSMAEGERMTEAGLGRALVWGAIGQKDSQNWVPHSG